MREVDEARRARLAAVDRVIVRRACLAMWSGEGENAVARAPCDNITKNASGVVAAVRSGASNAAVWVVCETIRACPAVFAGVEVRRAFITQRTAPRVGALTRAARATIAGGRSGALAAVRKRAHKNAVRVTIIAVRARGAALRGVSVRWAFVACLANPLTRARALAALIRIATHHTRVAITVGTICARAEAIRVALEASSACPAVARGG